MKILIGSLLSVSMACNSQNTVSNNITSDVPPKTPRIIDVTDVGTENTIGYFYCDFFDPKTLEEETNIIRDRLLDRYRNNLKNYLNQSYRYCSQDSIEIDDSDINIIADASFESPSEASAQSPVENSEPIFTNTNIQEDSVDESDYIKTDGEFIFVTNTLGKLEIYRSWPADEFHFEKEINMIPDSIDIGRISSSEIYLTDSKLIYIASVHDTYPKNDHQTLVHVFDRDGDFLQSSYHKLYNNQVLKTTRFIQDKIYLIGTRDKIYSYSGHYSFGEIDVSSLENYLEQDEQARTNFCEYGIDANYDIKGWIQGWDERVDEIVERQVSYILNNEDEYNRLIQNPADQESQDLASCDKKYIENIDLDLNYKSYSKDQITTLTSLDINDENQSLQTCVDSNYVNHIYVSQNSVYLISELHLLNIPYHSEVELAPIDAVSMIHKFNLNSDGTHPYFSTGYVPGTVLNRYSLGEQKDYLRLATTIGVIGGQNMSRQSNALYVLDASKVGLPVAGKIKNIAPGESLYSARFIGDKGYLVTFKKVDPFFTVDLSDPKNPEIKGELKIPGYSNYLHAFDENHIIGFGKDTVEAENGDFAWFQGLKLSLFDIKNFENPMEKDQEVFGVRGTESQALFDFKAFNLSRTYQKLALPVRYFGGDVTGNEFGQFEYSGIHLFDVNQDEGFSLNTVINLDRDQEGDFCFNSESPVRTIMMGEDRLEVIYALTDSAIFQINLNEENSLTKINLRVPEDWDLTGTRCWSGLSD